jgi:crotonobetainyl-CoA:carnitine CoA-transferase CaiB-like acyl-CoA transferase
LPIGKDPAPSVVDRARKRYSDGALGDLRVIELADEKGEWCGKLLADAGADVIKVEPPGGAPERNIGPFANDEQDPERSLHFWHYNTSKRGVTLDVETEDGREQLRKLVATADVLLETFAPGYMASIGLGWDELRAINPRLVMCSLTDFGQTGPWRDYKASDMTHLAAGGQMGCCGYDPDDDPEQRPIAPGGGNAWHTGSHFAYIAIMTAINYRDFTGVGQYIDTSVHGALALTTEMHVPTWIYNRQVVKRQTGRHAGANALNFAAVRSQHMCKDGKYVNFGVGRVTAPRLPVLVEWMDSCGFEHDLHDPKYADPANVTAEADHISTLLERFIGTLTSEEVYHGAQDREFLCGAVRAPEDAIGDPHWQDRGFFVQVEHPELGRSFTYPGAASLYGASPTVISRRAPLLGEHNAEVFAEIGVIAAAEGAALAGAPGM